jgi:hypothetical protein
MEDESALAPDRAARDEEDARLLEAGDHAALLAAYYPTILLRLRTRRLPIDEAEEVRQRVVEHLLRELRSGKRFDIPFRVVVHQRTTWTLLDYFKERQRQPGELVDERLVVSTSTVSSKNFRRASGKSSSCAGSTASTCRRSGRPSG